MHEAVAPVRLEVGLRRAPRGERVGPRPCPPQVVGLLADLDDRAVRQARQHRRHLAPGHRHHDLVQHRQPLRPPAQQHERMAEAEPAERRQVGVVVALGDGDDVGERGVGRRRVLVDHQRGQRPGDLDVAPFDAVEPGVDDQPPGALVPPGGRRVRPGDVEGEPEPERAPSGAPATSSSSMQAWYARAHASVLSPSAPVRNRAIANRSRSSTASGAAPSAAPSATTASPHLRCAHASRPLSSVPATRTVSPTTARSAHHRGPDPQDGWHAACRRETPVGGRQARRQGRRGIDDVRRCVESVRRRGGGPRPAGDVARARRRGARHPADDGLAGDVPPAAGRAARRARSSWSSSAPCAPRAPATTGPTPTRPGSPSSARCCGPPASTSCRRW